MVSIRIANPVGDSGRDIDPDWLGRTNLQGLQDKEPQRRFKISHDFHLSRC